MKILFIGDVFGSIGREMIEDYLHRIVKDNQIDFVIANVENAIMMSYHFREFKP